jgi:hypothetical protein
MSTVLCTKGENRLFLALQPHVGMTQSSLAAVVASEDNPQLSGCTLAAGQDTSIQSLHLFFLQGGLCLDCLPWKCGQNV